MCPGSGPVETVVPVISLVLSREGRAKGRPLAPCIAAATGNDSASHRDGVLVRESPTSHSEVSASGATTVQPPGLSGDAAASADLEGTGEIRLRDLVKESLRMRPSRAIVGGVRGWTAPRQS
jgi:hypothetical protein